MDVSTALQPGEHHLTLHAVDGDRDTLTWVLATSPAFGELKASGEGYNLFLDFVPGPAFQGADAFTIHLSDGHNPPSIIEVTISGEIQTLAPVTPLCETTSKVFLPLVIR
jgi:hypothetical protein